MKRTKFKAAKVIIPALLAVPAMMPATAQPVFEHQFTYSATTFDIGGSQKYFAMDNINNRCMLYNLDYSGYRTIELTLPQDYYMYNIQHVSDHLFNQDDSIELVYICSKYNPLETSYYYSYETRVINENGNEILRIPGAGHTEVMPTIRGMRFLVYIYDFSVSPATTQTRVYSLPEPPAGSADLKSGPSYRLGNPFPNPAPGGMTTIPVRLPPGARSGWLVLYNIYGHEVGRHPVSKDDREISLMPGGRMIPGLYMYNIQAGDQKSETKKITVQ